MTLNKPKLALAYSVRDPAGSGAVERLLRITDARDTECPHTVKCYRLEYYEVLVGGFDVDTPFFEFLDRAPDPEADAVIVLSRHSSESGAKTLTVHHTGNPSSAVYGGEPGRLSIAYPALSKSLLKAYRAAAESRGILDEYDLKLEATHHGPTRPRKPLVFIEIGSTMNAWSDPRAQEAMAVAVLSVLEQGLEECIPAAGFGGSHYPIKFTRLQLESNYCLGHIIPKYAFRSDIDLPNITYQAVERTYPRRVDLALIEKKSLRSTERKNLEEILRNVGVDFEYV